MEVEVQGELQRLHEAHRARLQRINNAAFRSPVRRPVQKPVEPEDIKSITFYPQAPEYYWRRMWFGDLVFGEARCASMYLTVSEIQNAVAAHFNMTVPVLLAENRVAQVVYARQVGMYLARRYTKHSLAEIGRRFGDRDHTTVLHAKKKIERLISEQELMRDHISALKSKLGVI